VVNAAAVDVCQLLQPCTATRCANTGEANIKMELAGAAHRPPRTRLVIACASKPNAAPVQTSASSHLGLRARITCCTSPAAPFQHT